MLDLSKETMTKINLNAPRLWLLGIISNLIINLQKIQTNFAARKLQDKLTLKATPSAVISDMNMILDKEMRSACEGALQDLIDMFIPFSILGWINLSPGTVGLLGAITSLMGAKNLYPPKSN